MRVQIPSCLMFVSACLFFFELHTISVSAQCLSDQKSSLLSLKNDLKFDSSHSTKLVGWNRSVECCTWGGVSCDETGHVIVLDLRNESISGGIKTSSQWKGLNRLEFLSFGGNFLSGKLPESLLQIPSLLGLDLSNNKLSGRVSDLIRVSSYKLTNLDLSSNSFQGSIPEFIFKIPTISTLTLSKNKFSGSVDLDVFGKLKDLYSLDLSYNDLTVIVNERGSFSTLTKLNSLMLASCKLQKVPDIKNHTRLMMLDLSVNELTGEIPSWIWQVGNGYLRFMNLSHNHFSGLQKPYTFPFLLDVLDLHSNELKGDIPVPPRRVYILDYSSNKFGSSIPVDFGNVLRSTLTFSISNSKVVGVIPESIRNASSLRVLDLSRNGLTGSIPLIGNLKDLQSLDLSVNKLTGRIPEQLTNLTSLSFLNVSYNHLSGKIPQGSRFQAFTELSYKGNDGLCGPPLKKSCGKRMS
ncbi:leucine-rich repeat protein [Tanacetum coccineum]|uniref:Leucine-rich repeat protein n=1 Tax=Tanacetum coccineum TaxID=301880 RepID=A0ABQ5F8N0_9ASTR